METKIAFRNQLRAVLDVSISSIDSTLTLTDKSGDWSYGPDDVFVLTVSDPLDSDDCEIMVVEPAAGNTYNIRERGVDSTAKEWEAGALVEMRIPRRVLETLVQDTWVASLPQNPSVAMTLGVDKRSVLIGEINPNLVTNPEITEDCVVIGRQAWLDGESAGTGGVAVGAQSGGQGNRTVAIGASALSRAECSVAIGAGAMSATAGQIVLGASYVELGESSGAQFCIYTFQMIGPGSSFVLTTNGGIPQDDNQPSMVDLPGVLRLRGSIVARSENDYAVWDVSILAFADENGTLAPLIIDAVDVLHKSSGASSWDLSMSIDSVNNAVQLSALADVDALWTGVLTGTQAFLIEEPLE